MPRRAASNAAIVCRGVGGLEGAEAQHDRAATGLAEPGRVRFRGAVRLEERRVRNWSLVGVDPLRAVLAVLERDRFLHEHLRTRGDRGVDEVA